MSQQPLNVKIALTQKPTFVNRPGVVQVLQTGSNIGGQTIIQQRSPAFKPFTTVRPYVPSGGVPVNTNTALQYVRKADMTVLNSAGGFVAPSLTQTFAPYVSPLMTLNPNVIQPLSGHGVAPGSVGGLGTSGPVLSSLANSRKPCNCTKSHCLKLYCECFAQGQLCQNCNCNNCMNNLAYEEERGRAIKMTLERNPTAFHPKIGRGEGERKHTKGCNCKRSGCLKNYCECYEAKISCSDLCRCQGCRNTEDSVERRSLMRLAAMGSLRSRQPASFKKHLIKPETLPHVFFTWEVIEATVGCLLAQAEEAERRDLPPAAQERLILEEFGRILEHVIDSASKAQIRSSSSIPGGDSENEHSLLHTGPTQVPVNLAPRSATAVGSATAAAAAADVLLRDDDDDDDEMMREIGVDDDDDDTGDLEEDIYDDDELGGPSSAHQINSQRHTRSSLSRVSTAHRAGHGHSDMMDDDISDDGGDGLSSGRNIAGLISHKYKQSLNNRSRSSHSMEARYRTHSRRLTSGGRGHEHDPDSVI